MSELVINPDEPKKKKVRKNMTPVNKYEHFLQKILVQCKMIKVSYFQDQGLAEFLEKLEAQG